MGRFKKHTLTIVLAMLLGSGAIGLSTLAWVHKLEEDNAFCNSCHVGGKPLHTRQYLQVSQGNGHSLGAAHNTRVRDEGGRRRDMRCIDCHKGVSLPENAHFHWVAFRDFVVYLAGQGEEPKKLSRPIPDVNCTTGCHTRITGGKFHQYRAHQGSMNVLCSECHTVHRPGDGPARTIPAESKSFCARCHPGLSDKVLRAAGVIPDPEVIPAGAKPGGNGWGADPVRFR